MKIKRITAFLLTVLLCAFPLFSCQKKDDIKTEVAYRVYDVDDTGDKISFYLSSDTEKYGKWSYDLSQVAVLKEFAMTDNNSGGKNTSRITLVLEPVSEGTATVKFQTEKSSQTAEFTVTVTKSSDGKFKIEAK